MSLLLALVELIDETSHKVALMFMYLVYTMIHNISQLLVNHIKFRHRC